MVMTSDDVNDDDGTVDCMIMFFFLGLLPGFRLWQRCASSLEIFGCSLLLTTQTQVTRQRFCCCLVTAQPRWLQVAFISTLSGWGRSP